MSLIPLFRVDRLRGPERVDPPSAGESDCFVPLPLPLPSPSASDIGVVITTRERQTYKNNVGWSGSNLVGTLAALGRGAFFGSCFN